jgi:recombinational DNA repair ATPase RecF
LNRLKQIDITGFRGALQILQLDFQANCRSMAIYGENGTGKSTISDAVEWFYRGRVDHLWHEDCKMQALRHALLDAQSDSTVRIAFSNSALDNTKRLSHFFLTSQSNSTTGFQQYLDKTGRGGERLFLRNADLLRFIVSSKTDKRRELAAIIGYDELESFKSTLKHTQTQLQNDQRYVSSNADVSAHQSEILTICGQMISSEPDLYQAGQLLADKHGRADIVINDQNSYDAAIAQIRSQIVDQGHAQQTLTLSEIRDNCRAARGLLMEVASGIGAYLTTYGKLLDSAEDVRSLKIEEFLVQSKRILDESLLDQGNCPLCLQPASWEELVQTVSGRLAKIGENKAKYEKAEAAKALAISNIRRCVRAVEMLLNKPANLSPELTATLTTVKVKLEEFENQVDNDFYQFKKTENSVSTQCNEADQLLEAELAQLNPQIKALEAPSKDQTLINLIRALENLNTWTVKLFSARQIKQKFERQIVTLEELRKKFEQTQSAALEKVLNEISGLVSSYYLKMHPNENVDSVRLMVLSGGVELEYGFHGKLTYPPRKYLSESHLNSLGIAVFLAAVKLFNKLNEFFILDDIVTSMDANHRVRLVRLLKEEFSDWQILLLTHDKFWFEMIKKELLPKGWLANEFEIGQDAVLRLKTSFKDLLSDISQKKASGQLTANDLRRALERILKELCLSLEVKVSFRFNDENERRMAPELLNALKSTLRKKNPQLGEDEVLKRLETSSLVTNAGSHDSEFTISAGDLDTTYEDILDLQKLFSCPDCSRFVNIEFLVGKKAHCKCGKKSIDWKE